MGITNDVKHPLEADDDPGDIGDGNYWLDTQHTSGVLRERVGGAWSPPRGSAGALPPVDTSKGGPGFGVDITAPVVDPSSAVAFGERFTLEDASPSALAIDNAYMAWSPDTPAVVTVKQAGWYVVNSYVQFFPALASSALVQLSPVNLAQPLPADTTIFEAASPTWIDADTNVEMTVAATGTMSHAGLWLVPMFTLSH